MSIILFKDIIKKLTIDIIGIEKKRIVALIYPCYWYERITITSIFY